MKRIVIVGASSGIGKRIALDFAQRGWRVGVAARREAPMRQMAEEHPGQIVYHVLDAAAPDAATRFEELVAKTGGMDVLLYASGVGFANPDLEPGLDSQIVDVNVKGFTTIVTAAFRYFAKEDRPGRIAAITSVAGTKGLGVAATYSASKRYQQNLLQALDQLAHMRKLPIGITDIRPGFVRTALLDPNKAYPLTMAVSYAAPLMVKAIVRGCRVATIDWRWGLITGLWNLIPNCLWPLLPVQAFEK